MDKQAIFCKTTSGEDAVEQRSIVQRNLRSVLIMIDGQTTVEEIAHRFPDKGTAEALIGELEMRGLIKRVGGGAEEAQEPDADQGSAVFEIESFDLGEQELLDFSTSKTPPESAPKKPRKSEPSPADFGSDDLPDFDQSGTAEDIAAREARRAEIRRSLAEARESAKAFESQPEPKGLDKLRVWWAELNGGSQPQIKAAESAPEPVTAATLRARRPKPLRRVLLGLFLVVGVVAGGLALYPYDREIPRIEKLSSELLNQPVKVSSVKPWLLPPSLSLEGVRVGAGGELKIARIFLVPEPFSLFSERKVIREARLEGAVLDAQHFATLPLSVEANWASRWVKIESVRLQQTTLELLGGKLSGLDGTATLNAEGVPDRIDLQSEGKNLQISAQLKDKAWDLTLKASSWQAPGLAALTVDSVEASGRLTPNKLDITHFDLHAFGGYLEGQLGMNWKQGDAEVTGGFASTRLDARKFLQVFIPDAKVGGELSLKLALRGRAESLAALVPQCAVDGTFRIEDGILEKFDLMNSLRNTSAGPTGGGSTNFDTFSGRVRVTNGGVRLDDLKLNSGMFAATGALTLTPGEKATLNGQMDVVLHGSATVVRAPVRISGSPAAPQLRAGALVR
ncbi:MAG: hypothetical protein KF778_16560 [Rhodocyclaceae bacterium]|nr:hypothetical protein [Rhodocyclaceae bacterium]MBX3670015.1 hypothetical protein [Rhodocyclaceae bacterium]